jgi:hypothetical protein
MLVTARSTVRNTPITAEGGKHCWFSLLPSSLDITRLPSYGSRVCHLLEIVAAGEAEVFLECFASGF